MFVPGADGGLVPSFDMTRPAPGFVEGSVYRPGDIQVHIDPFVDAPYAVVDEVDILFVIDNSCGSDFEQLNASVAAWALLDGLDDAALNYRIGVTTTDVEGLAGTNGTEGRLFEANGIRWVDADVPKASDALAALMQVGSAGSDSARGLAALLEAIVVPDNADFFRPEGSLGAVFVSDSANVSLFDDPTPLDTVAWLDTLKVSPATVTAFSATTGFGTDYQTVVAGTGGVTVHPDGVGFIELYDAIADWAGAGSWLQPVAGVVDDGIEAWWVPDGAEPEPFRASAVVYDPRRGIRVQLEGQTWR